MNEIKPLLRQMIENNKPYWRTRTIRGAHSLLDEYEAKAKAFDEIIYAINSSSNPGLNDSSYIDAIYFTSKVEYIVRKYESECESE